MPSGNTRKNRGSRRNRRNRRQYGGTQMFAPSPLGQSLAGSSPSSANLAQGGQYASFHANQHGGMAPYPGGVTDETVRITHVPKNEIQILSGGFAFGME